MAFTVQEASRVLRWIQARVRQRKAISGLMHSPDFIEYIEVFCVAVRTVARG